MLAMLSKLKNLFRQKLIKVSLLNSIAVVTKMAVLFGINKVLATFVGPSGYALLGQFQNIVQIISTFGGGAINTGVTKYTAQYEGNSEHQHRLWSTALWISLVGSILTMLLLITFRVKASIWLLHDEQYSSVFIWLAIGFIFLVFNTLLLAIMNGKSDIKLYVLANITGSIISFLVTLYLVSEMRLWGALVALSIYQSVTFFSTLLILQKAVWFKLKNFLHWPEYGAAKKLFQFTLMAATTVLCAPIANIVVRDSIVSSLGKFPAGYWEGMNRLSAGYLMLFTSVLSVYYLPKFSALIKDDDIKNEIKNGYKVVLPFVVICSMTVYLLRDFIIGLLFTHDFLPMRELFAWFMIGDVLKIGSWLLSFLMLGKAMTKTFIAMELIFTATYIAFNLIFIELFGLNGTAIAYAINYLLYWLTMHIIIKKTIFQNTL
jgi:PST family polysaccharide transporter